MGNVLGGKKRTAKIMKVDGSMFKVKPPAQAMNVLRNHAGYNLLESEEVKRLGVGAKPLDPDAPLKPGKLYFLVELPRPPADVDRRGPRRVRSGALHLGARERLESLMLSRRTMSDLYVVTKKSPPSAAMEATTAGDVEEITKDGAVRLRMRLPKAQVEKLIRESKDQVEAAEKIMELCVPKDGDAAGTGVAPRTPESTFPAPTTTVRKQKHIRFVATPDEIIS